MIKELAAQEKQMLAAICQSPRDDTPRLIYADWLEDSQTPWNVDRAEFIRLQIDHEWYPSCRYYGHMTQEQMSSRERRLFESAHENWTNGHRWTSQGVTITHQEFICGFPQYSRGFRAAVSCNYKTWQELGPYAVTFWPLQRVKITDRTPHGTTGCWGWMNGELWLEDGHSDVAGRRDCDLCDPIWQELDGHTETWANSLSHSGRRLWKCYEGGRSLDNAYHHLSEACLRWARKKAFGLDYHVQVKGSCHEQ